MTMITPMTRRLMLKQGGAALVSLGLAPVFLARAASAQGRRRKVLIVVFQRGAVDGLNMVVPFGEPDYYFSRPSIAISRPGQPGDSALALDDFFGLHPRLAPLQPLYRRRELAIVHACGSPMSTRSHFDAQDYLESGTPGVKSTSDGWLNRYLQEQPDLDATPFRGVALTPQRPRALDGEAPTLVIPDLSRLRIRHGPDGDLRAAFRDRYRAEADELLGSAAREAFDALNLLDGVGQQEARPTNGATYPSTAYGRALQQIAQLIKADVGVEVAFAESQGWDHHANEGGATGQMARGLDDFARGLAALYTDLGDRMEDVVILTMSEFGRSVEENGSRGTDHGHGNVMLLLGGGVRGGEIHGQWPGLRREQRFENRDLAVTTDFRDLFGEVLVQHLGLSADSANQIFPGYELATGRFPGAIR
jgi:uncharacterized protein (DUF1501 family)